MGQERANAPPRLCRNRLRRALPFALGEAMSTVVLREPHPSELQLPNRFVHSNVRHVNSAMPLHRKCSMCRAPASIAFSQYAQKGPCISSSERQMCARSLPSRQLQLSRPGRNSAKHSGARTLSLSSRFIPSANLRRGAASAARIWRVDRIAEGADDRLRNETPSGLEGVSPVRFRSPRARGGRGSRASAALLRQGGSGRRRAPRPAPSRFPLPASASRG